MATSKAAGDTGRLLRVTESFSGTHDGVPFVLNAGQTIREGHPYLKGREQYTEEYTRADHEWPPDNSLRPQRGQVEQATAGPGERRNR